MATENEKSLSMDEFLTLGIDDLLSSCSTPCYSTYLQKFSTLAQEEQTRNVNRASILFFLARLCSMILIPDNFQQPFGPMFTISTTRGIILDDLTEEEVLFCQKISTCISNDYLKARIFDLLWTLDKKNISYAKSAVEAYMAVSLDNDFLHREHYDMWERAIRLMLKLRGAFDDSKDIAREKILAVFQKIEYSENFRIIQLADLLLLLCNSPELYNSIFRKLFAWGESASQRESWNWARDFYQKTMVWVTKFDPSNQERLFEIHYRIGKAWEDEAGNSRSKKMSSGLAYGNALKSYRTIPRRYREKYDIDKKLSEVQKKMRDANIGMEDEFSSIETELNLKTIIEDSQKKIHGKDICVALRILANIHPWLNEDELREQSDQINSGSLTNIVARKYYSTDGRVVAFSPGVDLNDPNTEASELTSHCNLMQLYTLKIAIIVQGCILPALNIFNIEHRITEYNLYSLCLNSVCIPQDRALFCAKGLYYGFEQKFIEATHILSPQVEHFIRILLKQAGHKTSTVDSAGIENETGLSTLLEHEKIKEILPANMLFELKSLMTTQPGPNLRNEIAHGLISENVTQSYQGIYLWWLVLKIMIHGLFYKDEELLCT